MWLRFSIIKYWVTLLFNFSMDTTEQEHELNENQDQWDSLNFNRTEDEWRGKNFLTWRMETRTILNKIKATLVEEIKAIVKIPESIQKVNSNNCKAVDDVFLQKHHFIRRGFLSPIVLYVVIIWSYRQDK